MPTIINSLLVTLGLKADDFHKEQKKVQTGLDDLGKSAAKFLAIIGGTYEIKRFIQNQIEANSALERFSENLGESANQISAWSNAAELAGGSGRELQGTMDMLSRAQTELRLTGQSGLIPYLSALGVSLANTNGQARPVNDILLDLSDRFGRMNRTTANNMGRMMGIDQGTINLLLKGRTEVELYLKRQKEYNAVTNAQAKEAEKLRFAMVQTQQSFTAFGRALLQDVSPYLEKVLSLFQDFGDWMRDNKDLVKSFLSIMAVGIAAISIAAIPISATVAAFVALAAAMALAWQDFQVWKTGGNSLFNWGPAVDYITHAFIGMRLVINSVLNRLAHVGAALMALANGQWSIARDAMQVALSGHLAGEGASGDDRQRFITSAASKLGVPASAIDAQLRLETGASGASTIGAYNYGNIKAGKGYAGNTKSKDVSEYINGLRYTELAQFRSYSTPEEAASDYAAMISRKFPGAVGAQNATDYARGLQAGGYATDPNYVGKISNIAAGIPGASAAASGAGHGVAYPSNAVSSSSVVNIGEVNVNAPNATDANGIAKDMGKSLDYLFTSQANYGLR